MLSPEKPVGILPPPYVADHLPWRRDFIENMRSTDFAFSFEVPRSVEALYPLIRDSAGINKRLLFPKFALKESRGVTEAKWKVGKITLSTWIENPFEWHEPHFLQSLRTFKNNPLLRHLRVRFELLPLSIEENSPRTRVWISIGFVPTLSLWRPLGKLITRATAAWMRLRMKGWMHYATSKKYALVTRVYEQEPKPLPTKSSVRGLGTPIELAERLFAYIRKTPDDDLFRLRPKPLARELNAPVRDTMLLLLHQTREGALLLTWDLICPHCRSSRRSLETLGDIPNTASCEPCGIDFDVSATNAVEVTFRIHPSVKRIGDRVFCSAGALAKPHIVVQQWAESATTSTWQLNIPPGHYRARFTKQNGYALVEAMENGPELQIWNGEQDTTVFVKTQGRLQARNPGPRSLFVLERTDEDMLATRPAELFSYPQFRELFPNEAIASGTSLEIGDQTLLLTDVVGSTMLYETVDNVQAFAQVREHFISVFEIVQNHGGIIVKTIGDAALTVFPDPVAAFRAALELQAAFPPSRSIRIRVVINRGHCVAVNLNTGVDYFGKAVNRTAKMEKLAAAGDIVIAQSVAEVPGVQSELRNLTTESGSLRFDGNPTPYHYVKVSGTSVLAFRGNSGAHLRRSG